MSLLRPRLWHCLGVCASVLASAVPAFAADNLLQPFGPAVGPTAAPWRLALLPNQTKPVTQFSLVDLAGQRALKVEAELSYGNLLQPLTEPAATAATQLAWRWKVELLNEQADLKVRAGDDATLKVCTLWDEPLDKLSFGDRQLLRLARSASGEQLPSATVCYVWDAKLAVGTELDSPFTHRLRYIVLRKGSGAASSAASGAASAWASEKRDIAADFLRVFGAEAKQLPPLIGIAVGADSDNTQSHSIGYVTDLVLTP